MRLRPRQTEFVDRSLAALKEHNNTLGVAPTGAGKTVMLSAIAAKMPEPGLVVQHRIELVDQNRGTFLRMNPRAETSLFTADRKNFTRHGWTFGMIQSLAPAIEDMPKLGSIVIDEAHHSTADTYLRLLDVAKKKNPDIKILGVTATPARGDKRTLRAVFSNVSDQITLRELIATGHLVKPRTFVIDAGVREALKGVRQLKSDYDMDAVAEIMDKSVLNERVVEEWRKIAGGRRTVVFAANVAHAQHVTQTFTDAGIPAGMVEGTMSPAARAGILKDFDKGTLRVVVNVAVLTEGWDCQPVSCVILLRPSSYRSTMMQMVGRGLRKVDPERYPGETKDDCIILDFGTSILQHGSIETDKSLGEGNILACKACGGMVPAACPECPLCGADLRPPPEEDEEAAEEAEKPGAARNTERGVLENFVLTEVDLLAQSPYRWEELWNGAVMIATAFDAWACMVNYGGRWIAIGGAKGEPVKLVACDAERLTALATADDFLRERGDDDTAAKNKRWLSMPPSDKQLALLGMNTMQAVGITRYRAACLLTWKFSEGIIRARVMEAINGAPAIRHSAA